MIPIAIPTRSEWSFKIPSTLEAIDLVCVQFQEWRAIHCAGVSAFRSELLLREALLNSVVHGKADAGANDSQSQIYGVVRCAFSPEGGRLLMTISDKGRGFNWRDLWNHHADAAATGGRGIEILRRYASAVRFNPKGNTVTLLQKF